MTTYYVKVGGNDGLNGRSWGNAWATVNKAATTATSGDLIIYGNGIYYLGAGQTTWNSGTIGNVITHQAFNRRLAVWEQSAVGSTVDMLAESYITLHELLIRGDDVHDQTAILRLYDCDHITLDDCEVGDSVKTQWGVRIRSGVGMRIADCTIHPNNGGAVEKSDGIVVYGNNTSDIEITNTEVYNCYHEGIKIAACDGALIADCHVHRTGSHGISIGDSDDTGYTLDDIMVRDCRVHDQDRTYDQGGGSWHNNIRIHRNASNVTILRNELYDAAACGVYVSCTAVGPLNIYNNTLYNQGLTVTADTAAVFFDGSKTPDNLAANINYKNNIVYVTQTGFEAFYADTSLESHIQADYNLYYSSSATKEIRRNGTTYTTFAAYKTAGYEPNAVIDDDPDFKDAANDDFTLQGCSPAIDEGVDIGQAYYGAAPDIGAHEYQRKGVICMIM